MPPCCLLVWGESSSLWAQNSSQVWAAERSAVWAAPASPWGSSLRLHGGKRRGCPSLACAAGLGDSWSKWALHIRAGAWPSGVCVRQGAGPLPAGGDCKMCGTLCPSFSSWLLCLYSPPGLVVEFYLRVRGSSPKLLSAAGVPVFKGGLQLRCRDANTVFLSGSSTFSIVLLRSSTLPLS